MRAGEVLGSDRNLFDSFQRCVVQLVDLVFGSELSDLRRGEQWLRESLLRRDRSRSRGFLFVIFSWRLRLQGENGLAGDERVSTRSDERCELVHASMKELPPVTEPPFVLREEQVISSAVNLGGHHRIASSVSWCCEGGQSAQHSLTCARESRRRCKIASGLIRSLPKIGSRERIASRMSSFRTGKW